MPNPLSRQEKMALSGELWDHPTDPVALKRALPWWGFDVSPIGRMVVLVGSIAFSGVASFFVADLVQVLGDYAFTHYVVDRLAEKYPQIIDGAKHDEPR